MYMQVKRPDWIIVNEIETSTQGILIEATKGHKDDTASIPVSEVSPALSSLVWRPTCTMFILSNRSFLKLTKKLFIHFRLKSVCIISQGQYGHGGWWLVV